ncbi:MAG: hypothetical protein QM528_06255 [Phycisphaerales bacterium]|nr:hypothetical protein [Phycisphaerales bacterium]
MSKNVQQDKLSLHKKGAEMILTQHRISDNQLLPSAEELQKIEQVSHGTIEWIKERAKNEQDARIRFNDNKISLATKDIRLTHSYNFTALFFAFIVIVLFTAVSYLLILSGRNIQGTIFGGGTLLIAVFYLFRIPRDQSKSISRNNQ